MLFGNREPRSLVARRRGAYRPRVQGLENRLLMATDLGGTAPPANPAVATVPRYGITEAGGQSVGGAGFSVTDVGDLTGSGYDDFVVGAPTVTNSGGRLNLGVGNNARVYLILGSATTNAGAISDWLGTLTPDQRVGDLNDLGNQQSTQNNPITGNPSYPFAGISFITSQEPGSQLGASVSAVGTINGHRAFLIGAPGGTDSNGANPGTGRAYLVYGSANMPTLASSSLTVDLDSASQNSGLNIVTFINQAAGAVNTNAGQRIGFSVSGAGDTYGGSTNNLMIGAPGAVENGLSAAGAVYLISGTSLPLSGTIPLSTVGQAGGIGGALFTGQASGDQAGYSLANAGDVDGNLTTTNVQLDDLLIGAPQIGTGPGKAYLIYGNTQLPSLATVTKGVNQIPLAAVGTTTVRGLVVQGANSGDMTGYSVSSALDFNGDGLDDFLIGSPGVNSNSGEVDMFYGVSVNSNPLSGTITLGAVPSAISFATFTGANVGDLAGWSVGSTLGINPTSTNPGSDIMIGAPGFNTLSGSVYLIPANDGLTGAVPLGNATNDSTVEAVQFTLTTPGVSSPAFLGSSVAGLMPDPLSGVQTHTADSDTIPDIIFGAAGYSGGVGRGLDGGAFILEGAFIKSLLKTPTSRLLTSKIGVDAPANGTTTTFVVSATTPNTVLIFVDSNTAFSPAFNPVTTLNPATVVVNGVAFPNATISQDPIDENGDGVPDAIITISPRSALNLLATTSVFTLTAKTLPTSLFPNQSYSSSASILVTGGSSGGGGGSGGTTSASGVSTPIGQIVLTSYIPPFGPDTYVPSLTTLSQSDNTYKPIPVSVAIQQFLPAAGFKARMFYYQNPGKKPAHQFGDTTEQGFNGGHRTTELSTSVFLRSSYKPGKTVAFTHKVPVVPVNLQKEQLAGPIAGVTREPAAAKKITIKAPATHVPAVKKK